MYTVIFITCASKSQARRIAKAMVKERLVACVNIVKEIESVFCWQGKTEHVKEALLMAKTKNSKINKVIKLVKSLHSYNVPEIIALPITSGYKPYLDWIDESVGKSS